MDTTLLKELGLDDERYGDLSSILDNIDMYKKTLQAMGQFPEYEQSTSEGSIDVKYNNPSNEDIIYANIPETY